MSRAKVPPVPARVVEAVKMLRLAWTWNEDEDAQAALFARIEEALAEAESRAEKAEAGWEFARMRSAQVEACYDHWRQRAERAEAERDALAERVEALAADAVAGAERMEREAGGRQSGLAITYRAWASALRAVVRSP